MNPKEKKKVVEAAGKDFAVFVNKVFSESFPGGWLGGNFIDKTCRFLQGSRKTVRISARDHFKSTSLYAHFCWNLFRNYNFHDFEAHYFSYERNMAAYHLAKIKELIAKNPWFTECHDHKSTAESVLKYSWDGKHFITLKPHGLLSFKRGIHADAIYVDDPFQDPENKLEPLKVQKINRIFSTQIMDMPKPKGFLHCVGTPQTPEDFYFDEKLMQRFDVQVLPAVTSEVNKTVLWPEHMSWNELMIRRDERGERVFNQEYLCKPYSAEHAWIQKERLLECVNPDLKMQFFRNGNNITALGMDVGKKVHPSHIAIFERMNNIWVLVHHEFLDKVDYIEQLKIVNDLIQRFQVDYAFYDATRGEFDSFAEQKLLSPILQPVIFKSQTKYEMATNLDKIMTEQRILLPEDRRLLNQMLVVDSNLDALETNEGHGETFWSIALALSAEFKIKPERQPMLMTAKHPREVAKERFGLSRLHHQRQ